MTEKPGRPEHANPIREYALPGVRLRRTCCQTLLEEQHEPFCVAPQDLDYRSLTEVAARVLRGIGRATPWQRATARLFESGFDTPETDATFENETRLH